MKVDRLNNRQKGRQMKPLVGGIYGFTRTNRDEGRQIEQYIGM